MSHFFQQNILTFAPFFSIQSLDYDLTYALSWRPNKEKKWTSSQAFLKLDPRDSYWSNVQIFDQLLFCYCHSSMATSDTLPPLPLSLTLLPVPPSPPPPPPHMLCLAALVWPLPSLAGGRSRCPELANNNQGVALCDTPSLGLDNEQAPNSRFAGEWQPPEHGPMRAEDWECRDGGWREIQEERKREESYLQRTKGFLMH